MLGDDEEMTLDAPTLGDDGKLQGGTFFERLGQEGVKGTRCYSLTQTHQHSRGLVGPTAGGKIYDYKMSENEEIRHDAVKVRLISSPH